ncbi:nucleotidyltransferase family protein [Leptospira levettii]|nr:nucleotidyltransferase family protein [Leptospira levettii]
MKKTKIVIMCGGRGKRLGEITEKIPKPLVKIGSQTILQLKYENYYNQGFRDFIFCIGYKGDLIRNEVSSFAKDGNIEFSDSGEDAGILKRLHAALPLMSDSIILTYGDTFTDLDLNQLVSLHEESKCEATIVVAPIQNPFGLVEFDSRNRVTSFKEKPTLNYYIGYAVLDKSSFDYAPEKVFHLEDGQGLVTFYKIMIALDKLNTFYHSGLQITFNTEDELKVAQKQLIQFYTSVEEK